MSRVITRDQFEWAIFQGKIDRITRDHLEFFEYDPPTLRAAIVSYGNATWRIVKMVALDVSSTRRFRALHEYGMLLLGDPPWRFAKCVTTYGRLGYLERMVAALPPGPVEPAYAFPVEEGRAMCRPDEIEFYEDGLPLVPPADRDRLTMMSDRMRWRKVYDRYADDVARELRLKSERERMK